MSFDFSQGSFEEIELYESYQKFVLVPKVKQSNRSKVHKTQSNYEHLLIIDRFVFILNFKHFLPDKVKKLKN
jgi:hypothetical protein